MSYLEEMFSLKGQSAVITGGAGGIGTEMSRALLKAHANVVIWSRSRESINRALEKLNDSGAERIKGVVVDTGLEESVEEALQHSIAI